MDESVYSGLLGEADPHWAFGTGFAEPLAGVDTILLSRAMAEEGYIDHWTRAGERFADDPHYAFARRVAAAHKRVLSR